MPDEAHAKSEADSKKERADDVREQLSGEDTPDTTDRRSQVGPTGGGEAKMAPEGVGTSYTRGGEQISGQEGKEAGRVDTGADDSETGRPTGESTPRDRSGVDPQDGPDT